MTADAIAVLESAFKLLARESVSGAVLAGAVWAACRTLPALPASARAMLWWVVSLKLLVGLAWVAPVSLPVLPAGELLPAVMRQDASFAASTLASVVVPQRALEAMPAPPVAPALSWQAKAAALWVIGLLAISIRFAWQLRRWTATRAQAQRSSEERQSTVRSLARLMGVARAPVVYDSDDVESPMLVGLFRPRIVVPRDRFDALTPAEQRMALCHELAHHRRADLWLGIVPALAERVFFFHPLARLAAREYLVAREAACDAAVVDAIGVSAHDYGRLLLTLGVSPVGARFAAAGTSRTFSSLKRRILMLGLPTPTRKVQTAGWLLTGLAALALVPVQLVGRAQYADVPSPPAADLALEPPAAAPQVWQRSGREKDFSYAILYGENSMMMDGHDISSERLQRLRGNDARLFWFEIAGREYVVRDPAGIDRALAVTKVVRELGAAQGEVGSKQGAIGAQQGQVGAKQGAIGAQQGQIGAKQGAIGAKQAALAAKEVAATDAERRQLDRQQTELDAEMRKLDAEMRVLDQHMREADQPMADLDAKMRVLDDEMRVLDGKMHEAEKKMEVEMRQLIEKLIAEKVAQPL
jgi:beta-lactamase regulating signal transducer with metallopeptidase domain